MRYEALPHPSPARVLLVDDMHEDALLLADVLAPLALSILVAQSTAEALAIVDKEAVDLVVTDLNMPGGSGLDLALALRSRQPAAAVIFVTGSLSERDKVEAFELGAVAYLPKPVNIGRLIGFVKEILRSRGPRPEEDPAS